VILDCRQAWHLQLLGRPIDGGPLIGRPRPLGQRIFLPEGTFADAGRGLGITNRDLILLPGDWFRLPWLLEGYEIWDEHAGGNLMKRLELVQPVSLHQQAMEALPPCSIRLDALRQSAFSVNSLSRNPCPAWSERIHLYQCADRPFDVTSVIYLGRDGQIAAAELFNVMLRPLKGETEPQMAPRCWVQYMN
jgi:hypothetical protein